MDECRKKKKTEETRPKCSKFDEYINLQSQPTPSTRNIKTKLSKTSDRNLIRSQSGRKQATCTEKQDKHNSLFLVGENCR